MAKKKSGSMASRLARWRWWIQAGFLFAWLDPFMLRMHTVCSPVFHCYSCPLATFACPIGVLANFSAVHLIPFAALGTLIFLAAAFGSFVCGWACPFGFLQDLIARIPTRKFTLPSWMGCFRYVSLIGLGICRAIFLGGRTSFVFLPSLPSRGPGRGTAKHGPGGNRGQGHSLAHGGKNHYFSSCFCWPCSLHGVLGVRCFVLWGQSTVFSTRFPCFS